MNIFITGCSRGLGKALADELTFSGHNVFGLSRHAVNFPLKKHFEIDLENYKDIKTKLKSFDESIDILFLNAGVLGGLIPQKDVSIEHLKKVLDINLFAQKEILDILLTKNNVKKVVCISSGAANKCRYGWGSYAISKASLMMLIKVYAAEYPDIKFLSLAPGLVDTDMQKEVYNTSLTAVPNVSDFRDKKDKGLIESPEIIANKIIKMILSDFKFDSGDFIDLRNITC